jgi:RimJ/RimL family protein N-acetyltransferase
VIGTEEMGTKRLVLLPLRVEHAREMAEVPSDPALHTYIGGTPQRAGDLTTRYERLVAGAPEPGVTWCNWVLRSRAEGVLVGTVQATITARETEIAWVVGTPWQGRGYATEAARALVDRLAARGVSTVVAHIHPDHHASAAVASAAGLSATGELHDGEVRWERRVSAPRGPRS